MTYEIIMSNSTAGIEVDLNCDDEELFNILHDDEIFQDLIGQLSARYRDVASSYDRRTSDEDV